MNCGGVVAEKNAAAVVRHEIVRDGGVVGTEEMDLLPAVELFPGLETWLAGASWNVRLEILIIVKHRVTLDGNARGVGHQDSFVVGVLNGKPGHHDVAEAGIAKAIDVIAIGKADRVDGGILRIRAYQRERFSDNNIFL